MARATYDTSVYKGLNAPQPRAIRGLAVNVVTDRDITALSHDSFSARNYAILAICESALAGNEAAWRMCERMILDTRMLEAESK